MQTAILLEYLTLLAIDILVQIGILWTVVDSQFTITPQTTSEGIPLQTDTQLADTLSTSILKDIQRDSQIGSLSAAVADFPQDRGITGIQTDTIRTVSLDLAIGGGIHSVGIRLVSIGIHYPWVGTVTLIFMTSIRRPDRHILVSTSLRINIYDTYD